MIEVIRKYRGTLIGLFFIVFGMLFYLIMQIFDLWTGPTDPSLFFCEYFDPDLLVGGPMNAWSNFYCVGVGMGILVYYDLVRNDKVKRRDTYILKDENSHYMVIYALLVIWLGFGSFYFHGAASGNELFSGHFFDVLGMNMYLGGLIIISLAILFDVKKTTLYIALLATFLLIIILMKMNIGHYFPNFGGGGIFEVLLLILFINEIIIGIGIYSKIFKNKGARQIKRNILILPIIIGIFLFAFWVWQFGHERSPLCEPYSLWQWHAVWHFLVACVNLAIALYILTENEKEV